jgi:aminoglycoside phosphotransferase (APT) family kinase protein
MAEYLVKIHRVKYSGTGRREIYERKIRDTVGHGECIFGLSDSYPRDTLSYLHEDELLEIEKKCVEQRWKLKENDSRLSQVHGDFHPWNILFDKNPKFPSRFVLLDRSRGQWGEPADDVCALSINYLFYSLRKYGALA